MNNEIIAKIIEKYNLDLGDDYFFVGATIIKKSDFSNSTKILYCEDGFNDEEGIPYIMQSVVPKGVLDRDRIIVFYTKDLRRYIIPIDGENYTLIGNGIPENVRNINYGKAKKIIHRKALELKKEPEKLSKEDKDALYKRYIKNYKKGRMVLAGLFSSLVWFILISLGVIFIIADIATENVNETLVMGSLIGGTVLFVGGAIVIINFFIRIPVRRLKSFAYKSDFLVMNYKRNVNIRVLNDCHIYGLTYDEDNCKLMTYAVFHYDVAFIKNVEYFEIVNRYSKNKNPKNLEYCLFERKDINRATIELAERTGIN